MKGKIGAMIRSKKELSEYIRADNDWLLPERMKEKMIASFVCYPSKSLKRFLFYLRKQEYYINTAEGNRVKGLLNLYFERKI